MSGPTRIHPSRQATLYELHTFQGRSAQELAQTYGHSVYAVNRAIKAEQARRATPPLKSTPTPLVGERIAARKARARNDR